MNFVHFVDFSDFADFNSADWQTFCFVPLKAPGSTSNFLIETYKILTGKENIDRDNFFVLSQDNHNIRGHKLKLYKSRCRLNTRKFFYSQRVVNVWNKLPSNVIEAEIVITFKNRLDKM